MEVIFFTLIVIVVMSGSAMFCGISPDPTCSHCWKRKHKHVKLGEYRYCPETDHKFETWGGGFY